MAIRNFWIEGDCSDRNSPIGFGPKGDEDSVAVRLYMKVNGVAKLIYTIRGIVVGGAPEFTIISETQDGKVLDVVQSIP
jgi:hypothetical protein